MCHVSNYPANKTPFVALKRSLFRLFRNHEWRVIHGDVYGVVQTVGMYHTRAVALMVARQLAKEKRCELRAWSAGVVLPEVSVVVPQP